MKKAIISIILIAILFITSCTKTKSVNDYVKEYADSQNWFDYSYEIIDNYDETGTVRYHVFYYYSKANRISGKLEIIGYIKDNEFIYEVI